MGVLITGGLEPSHYWQDVCALANDLLTETPMRDWTVVITPQARAGPARGPGVAACWQCSLDLAAKELAVAVPAGGGDLDETEPEDAATYVVFDLLHERVLGDGEGDAEGEGEGEGEGATWQ